MGTEDSPTGMIGPVVQDALRPAAQEVGKTLSGLVRICFAPLNRRIWEFDQAAEYARENAERILHDRAVPLEAIQAPSPEIAAPAIHALRFPDQDQALRRLYLELIASAMDSRVLTHPSFVDVLRQFSPDEAKVLPLLAEGDSLIPMMSVRIYAAGGAFEYGRTRLRTLLGEQANLGHPLPEFSVNNLERLGVVTVRTEMSASGDAAKAAYDAMRRLPEMMAELGPVTYPFIRYHNPQGPVANLELLEITEFGRRLALACTGGSINTPAKDSQSSEGVGAP